MIIFALFAYPHSILQFYTFYIYNYVQLWTHGTANVCNHIQDRLLLDTSLNCHYWFEVQDQISQSMRSVLDLKSFCCGGSKGLAGLWTHQVVAVKKNVWKIDNMKYVI